MHSHTEQTQSNRQDHDIHIKKVFHILDRYKWSIVFITLFFTVATYTYLYFKPNIYKTFATVEVGKSSRVKQDVLSQLSDSMSLDTEVDIIKSRFVMHRALRDIDFTHKYYVIRNYKTIELYKKSPFSVDLEKGFGLEFTLKPIKDTREFELSVKGEENGEVWTYTNIHQYDQEIKESHFHLTVYKNKAMALRDNTYKFKVLSELSAVKMAMAGVGVEHSDGYSNIIKITNTDNIPLRGQEVVNALARAYLQQNIDKKTQEATKMLEFIDLQLITINSNLKDAALKLEDFKQSTSTAELSTKTQLIITKMSEYESRLVDISIEEKMLDSIYKQVKSGKNLGTLSVAGVSMKDSSLTDLIKKLQEAQLKKKILRKDYTEAYPKVVKLRSEILQLQSLIKNTVKNLKESVSDKRELIEDSLLQHEKRLKDLPEDERVYGRLERNFEVNKKIYSYLLEKRAETGILKASKVSKNRIIDDALISYVPIAPKRTKILVLGMMFGLLLGLLLAFLRDFLDDRIKSEDDLLSAESYAMLGVIPHIKQIDDMAVFSAPKSGLAEAFRNLRTNLQFMVPAGTSHTIAITSTVGSEGKTTVCVNLGSIMSLAEKKTIILNLDMRKPTLHTRFGLINKTGMSTLLSGHATLNEVIQETGKKNLDIISSGPVPPNPSELIQNPIMVETLNKLKSSYDVIILDTPPAGLVTDARTLMHYADTNIYVLRAEYSKKDFLKNIKRLSTFEDIKGLGIVLNDLTTDKNSYGYGYGYGYGYYEEDKKQ